MNRKMTFLAVAGNGGVLAASGFVAGAAFSRYDSASPPKPRPDRSRNRRLETASIDIQKLIHVEPQQTQPRKRALDEESHRLVLLFRRRRPAERGAPAGVDPGFPRFAILGLQARREPVGLLRHELAIHERER